MKALLDLSFDRFLVPVIVRWLYAACIGIATIVLIGTVIGAVLSVISAQSDIDALTATGASALELSAVAFRRDVSIGAIALAPLVSVAIVVLGRIAAEVTIVLFSIAESLKGES